MSGARRPPGVNGMTVEEQGAYLKRCWPETTFRLLMGLVAKRVADKHLLKLIRGFLTAGMLDSGPIGRTTEGTSQGGPLSLLLSNPMLDILDRELEKARPPASSAMPTTVRHDGAERRFR